MRPIFRKYSIYLVLFFIFFLLIPICNQTLYPVINEITSDGKGIYVPIIMYHAIKNHNTGKDTITPAEFENDLKYLKENNYNTITMAQLLDYVYEDKELPKNPIMITFDDGYLTTYVYAFPLLKEYDMKMVLSIIGKSTDDFTNVDDTHLEYAHMTWDEVNEMLDSGLVEVQNHSYNLHTTKRGRIGCRQKSGETFVEYENVLTEDVGKLQSEIVTITGEKPTTFIYPYGEFDENTIKIIKNLGFKAGLTCDYGINKITKDTEKLYALKRVCRAHGDTLDKLIKEVLKTIR